MSNAGFATLSIIPSAKGFHARLAKQVDPALVAAGASAGKTSGAAAGKGILAGALPSIGRVGGLLAAVGIGKVIKDSVNLEKTFSQTMATMGAVAQVPKAQLSQLSALAMKLGADTSFSASEAADAMLELAKSGITPADIKAGALAGTLTLAAAGGTDLSTAATIASNAMNTFNIKGSQMDSVAAALAGGANASSASVESLGQALQQVGPGATNAGLSLQDTVGTLSAFDAAGIKGSDAGTSLKTMLMRLVPQTDKASAAMRSLGLDFTASDGSFKSITNIAQQLHDKLGPLSEATRTQALTTIFGSDASRAATVLTKQGAAGLAKYIKATKDQTAAQKAAQARMSGTAGAIEQMHGAAETAELALGKLVAPAVTGGAHLLAKGFGGISDALVSATPKIQTFFSSLGKGGKGGGLMASLSSTFADVAKFGKALVPTLQSIGQKIVGVLGPGFAGISQVLQTTFLPAFRQILPILLPIAKFILNVLGSAVVGVLQGAFKIIQGVLQAIGGLFKIFASLVRGDWQGVWNGIKTFASGILKIVLGAIQVWWNLGIIGAFRKAGLKVLLSFKGLFKNLKGTALKGLEAVKGFFTRALGAIRGAIKSAVSWYFGLWRSLFRTLGSIASNGWKVLRSAFGGALRAIRSVVSGAMHAISGFFSRTFSGIRRVVSSAISGVVSTVRGLPGRALSALSGIGSKLAGAGRNLIQGFINGIVGMAGSITSAVRSTITDHLPGFVKKALGIHSPSRVFRAIGANVAEGMALGISDGASSVTKAADGLIPDPDVSVGVGRFASSPTTTSPRPHSPLIGALTLASSGNTHEDLDEVGFRLRTIRRGGLYA